MKVCILFTLVILISCSQKEKTPEQKAEATLKDHLSATVGKDYRPLQTRLDSFYAIYTATKEGSNLLNEYNSVHAENKDIYSPNALFLANREMSLLDTLNARTKRFGQRFYGWKAIHSYNYKNEKGILRESIDTFLLNRDYQLMQADTISF